jgi:hypothetical protein
MISEAPIAAAQSATSVLARFDAFIGAAKSASAGGITWSEFGELLLALIRMGVDTLDVFKAIPGSEKKQMVLEAIGRLFDGVAVMATPLAVYPLWFLARPAIRSLVLALASGAIEQVLPLVRSVDT